MSSEPTNLDRSWQHFIFIAITVGFACWLFAWCITEWSNPWAILVAFVSATYMMLAALALLVLSDAAIRSLLQSRARFTIRAVTVLITVLCCLLGCWKALDHWSDPFNYQPFDRAQWVNAKSPRDRGLMARDCICNHLRVGMPVDAVQDLLGNSDPQLRGPNTCTYYLGHWGRHRSPAYLDVNFDDDWRLVTAEITRID